MKLLVLFASVLAMAFAQRPWYAGSRPIGYPTLASRFKEDGGTTNQNINNRFNGNRQKIPIDALGDYDLVDRLNQRPRENRPFWLLNANHIESQRHTPGSGSNGNAPQNLPSRFGGQQGANYPDPYNYYSFGYDDFGNPKFYHY